MHFDNIGPATRAVKRKKNKISNSKNDKLDAKQIYKRDAKTTNLTRKNEISTR